MTNLLDAINQAIEREEAKRGQADSVFMNPKTYADLIRWQKYERWVNSLPDRQQKQVRLRDLLEGRKGLYKYKMNLPR